METIGDLVRRLEDEFIRGTTRISKYVNHSLYETLEKIEAYSYSKHVTGERDSKNRIKPFFNIGTAAWNIWYRATDIDRKHIQVKSRNVKNWINSFLATAKLQDWMYRHNYAAVLNKWGRALAKYGSAVLKFVENDEGLHIEVMPWSRMIVDPIDFDANPKIEVIELTEAQLRERIETHNYDKKQVEALCNARSPRETKDGQRKDNRSDYIKIYEVHGVLPLSNITDDEEDKNTFVQQMAVLAFVGVKEGRKTEYLDFVLYRGREEKDPYMITHLIEDENRTLSMGAFEHLFQAQWVINHSMKSIRDTLDIASKLVLQTADASFVGRNVLNNIESGQILVTAMNMPLTKVDNSKPDIASWQSYMGQWKTLGNEIVGVSEAMLGAQPKSGQAWRQTEALLTESYSLFELMTENKGNTIIRMMNERIIPWIKKHDLDTAEEVAAVFDSYNIDKIDSIYIKNEAIRLTNDSLAEKVLSGQIIQEGEQEMLLQQNTQELQGQLQTLGNVRYLKPSDIPTKTWKQQLKDFEWTIEVDVTGEGFDTKEALATINTALSWVMNPAYGANKQAQALVGKVLELTGAMSPIEYMSLPAPLPVGASNMSSGSVGGLVVNNNNERNIQ